MQDLIVFGLHTGLRVGEIFSLRWSDVDMEKNVLNILAQKTGKMRTIPLNSSGLKVLGAWSLNRKNDLVLYYNHGTGEKFVDLKAGFSLACKKAGISDVSWHTRDIHSHRDCSIEAWI
jgi:integrase